MGLLIGFVPGASNLQSDAMGERLSRLSEDHRRSIERFFGRLDQFIEDGLLNDAQAAVVAEHLLRLGERERNPANTGNIEDLFCHTLKDTGDVVRAYAQALADSVKVVPMDEEAQLIPPLRTVDGKRWFRTVKDLNHLSPGDKMLVTHTMAAYGDPEMWASAAELIRVTYPDLDEAEVDRGVARMAVQSQHLPSSSFVLARARGLTIDCRAMYERAGYSEEMVQAAQRFYDVCAEFDPEWTEEFMEGRTPMSLAWRSWRARYLESRQELPEELQYQLSSDTLTNFLDGTLESGKWTDASVFFAGVQSAGEVPASIARIVNQYLAEHVALHDRPAAELIVACSSTLQPWGIGFRDDRAVVLPEGATKAEELEAQFQAAMDRKSS